MRVEDIVIRKAVIEDCHALSMLKRDVWNSTYIGIYPREKLEGYDVKKNKLIFENIVANPEIDLFVAEVEGNLVGLMTVGRPYKLYDEYDQEVGLLYIRKDFQRLGLGKNFFDRAKENVRAKGFNKFIVSVNEKNNNAIAFYLAMGGRIVFEGEGQKRFLYEI